jgi:aminopeptidase N
MYYKGGNMLHTIRQVVNNDEKWRSILQGLNKDFWHQTVTTQQIESYITEHAGIDLSKVFDEYLRTTNIPVFQYKIEGNKLLYKWDRVVPGFAMPVRVSVDGKEVVLTPTENLNSQTFPTSIRSVEVNRNYYVKSEVLK